MALVLKESEVQQILTMNDGVRIVEEAFRHYAERKTTLAPRLVMKLSGVAGNFRIMAAIVPDMGGFGLKTLTGTPGKRAPENTYFAMLYFDIKSGALTAIIPATHITGIRTGAASGVATKYLARKDAKTVGLFGAGFQGGHQIAAIRAVRDIETVKVFDISRQAAEELCASLSGDGIDARVAESAEAAVRGSDIIASATTAKEPPIKGEWLEHGVHINAAGANAPVKQEIDADGFRRARVVVDFKEQVLQEAGDLIKAIQAGAISEDAIYAELGDIVTGHKTGRESDADITLFKSVGVAIEDVAVAAWVYDQARQKGLGLDLALQS